MFCSTRLDGLSTHLDRAVNLYMYEFITIHYHLKNSKCKMCENEFQCPKRGVTLIFVTAVIKLDSVSAS